MNRLILVDGTAMTYRSYFAFIRNPLRNSKGENTSAIFGVANSLLKILREQEFTHIAVCFDTPLPTFRHKIFPEYKATREKMPDELKGQIEDVKELIEAMGILVIEEEGVEADDVIGTLAEFALSSRYSVTVISWDKDFFQLLIKEGIDIIRPGRGKIAEELITPDVIKKKLDIDPSQMTDYLALIGDTSDNVPGVPGVGPKSATKLLKEFGNIENIIEYKEKIKSKKIASAIDEVQVNLSKKLVTIKKDLKIDVALNSLLYMGKKKEKLRELFSKFEFTSLLGMVEDESESEVNLKEVKVAEMLEITMGIKRLAAIEFCDVGASSFISLASSDNIWVAEVIGGETYEIIHPFFNKKKTLKISTDIKSLLHLIKAEDTVIGKDFFDLSIASYLLDPSRGSHTLDFISLRYGNKFLKKKQDLIKEFKKKKIGGEKIKNELARYVQTDIYLYTKLKTRLEDEGMEELFYNIEMPLLSVLARMEKSGILLEKGFFNNLSEEYEKNICDVEKNIYDIAGETFNVRSTKQLQQVLFEKLKLNPPRRIKTGFSTDSETLLILSSKHELPKEILKYRELYKLKSTYIDTLPKLADKNGRVHTTFVQTTTATGRLASRNPNLQNIPARGELGREIRKGFISPPGKKLLSCDYSQIELRILAHISDDANLKDAFFNDIDIHTKTASGIFRIAEENITREMRRRAKIINFGIIYGMSPYGLGQELGILPEEGMVIINSYFDTYPEVKEWIDRVSEETEQKGFAETLLGRRRMVPELKSKSFNTREFGKRIAMNTPIQGSAADIIKLAMLRLDERLRKESIGAKMLLQIHDELLFEIEEGCIEEAKDIIVNEMENAHPLSVPLKVEVGIGDNWFEA
ncbi:MAG: DNA polymerase I, partial [Candidatus Cloacimonadota bacterium]